MRFSERIDTESELAPNVVLARLLEEAGWRTDDEGLAFPYDPGAHRVRVCLRGNRFTIAMTSFMMKKTGGFAVTNSFSPVCEGTVKVTPCGENRVAGRFRLNWYGRLFLTACFGVFAFAAVSAVYDRSQHGTGYYSPAVEALFLGVTIIIFATPVMGVAALVVALSRRFKHIEDRTRKIIFRVTTSPVTAAPP